MNYRRALRRSWYLLVLGLVLGGTLGWLAYQQATPRYSATLGLSVGYADAQFSNEISSRDLAATRAEAFAQIAGAEPVVRAAAAAAGFPGVHATATGGTDQKSPLFTITVSSSNRDAVAPIANAYAQVLVPELTSLVGPMASQVRLNVVSPATQPGAPVSPKRSRDVALGLIGGFLLGLVVALLIEVLDLAVRSPEEITAVSGLKLLGTVPADDDDDPLPTLTHPRSPRAEAYRQIRTTWFARRPPARVIAVTSSTQGEGKTTVSTNLATTVARSGRSVVVVDADMRRPRVATVFGLDPDRPGLADLLTGEADLDDVVTEMGEAMPAVIPAGTVPTDPSEILSLDRFDDLVARLRARYDYVIVDTPPTLPVADALVVAPRVDAVFLVAAIGTATPQRIRRSIDALARVGASLAGVVPNGAKGPTAQDYTSGYDYRAPAPRTAAREDDRAPL